MVACIAAATRQRPDRRHGNRHVQRWNSATASVEATSAWPRRPELGPGMRFNDGRCDRQGRFWSGTMFMDMAAARDDGRLYRYDPERACRKPSYRSW
jgi:sugar lactone lactonase YvrE